MSGKPIRATFVGKWSVGFSKSLGQTLLMFEFTDREPINLAMTQDQAVALAKAVLEQASNAPSQPDQMN